MTAQFPSFSALLFLFLLSLSALFLLVSATSQPCSFYVISGDVSPTSAHVQASFANPACRLNPDNLSAVARLLVSRSPSFPASATRTRNITITSYAGLDPRQYPGSYVAKVFITNLRPFTRYYYRFIAPVGIASALASFRTLPNPMGHQNAHSKFVVLTGLNQPPFTAAKSVLKTNPHFTIINGDGVSANKAWLPSSPASQPRPTQLYYSNLYISEQRSPSYAGGPWISDLLRTVPTFALADDLEIFNDYVGDPGSPRAIEELGLNAGRDILPRRRINALYTVGMHAFLEHNAIPPGRLLDALPSSSSSSCSLHDVDRRIFRKFSLPEADVFLLDVRQYASTSIPLKSFIPVLPQRTTANFTWEGPFSSPQFCAVFPGPHGGQREEYRGRTAFRSGRTKLGRAQLCWFLRALRDSKKTFKLIVSPVYFADLYLAGAEMWVGVWPERQRLLSYIGRNKIWNVVFLSSGANGAIFSRINPRSKKNVPIFELISGPVGEFRGASRLGPAALIFENFARTFTANSHLIKNEKDKAVKFITISKSNVLQVDIKNGTLVAECEDGDGNVIIDQFGNVGRVTLT